MIHGFEFRTGYHLLVAVAQLVATDSNSRLLFQVLFPYELSGGQPAGRASALQQRLGGSSRLILLHHIILKNKTLGYSRGKAIL